MVCNDKVDIDEVGKNKVDEERMEGPEGEGAAAVRLGTE